MQQDTTAKRHLPDPESQFPRWLDVTGEDSHIRGTITGFSEAPSKFGRQVVINLVLDGTDEERALWLSQSVLKTRIAELEPHVGEAIEVACTGKKIGAGGNGYWGFRVTLPDRPPFKPDWKSMRDDESDWPEAVEPA